MYIYIILEYTYIYILLYLLIYRIVFTYISYHLLDNDNKRFFPLYLLFVQKQSGFKMEATYMYIYTYS